jgi:4-hydroxy-3-methylbut-2-enyl diphosphate reductase
LLGECDLLIVVGSRSSSNSNRLRELAQRTGVMGYLVDGPDELERAWFDGKQTVGVTAGASAPEILVQQVVERLRSWGGEMPTELPGSQETVVFGLPKMLRTRETV